MRFCLIQGLIRGKPVVNVQGGSIGNNVPGNSSENLWVLSPVPERVAGGALKGLRSGALSLAARDSLVPPSSTFLDFFLEKTHASKLLPLPSLWR